MKPIRWSDHARQNLRDREIDLAEAEKTLIDPEYIATGQQSRSIYMRRYQDQVLEQLMLLRLIVEDSATEMVVVTVYKTSQITKYLGEHLK